MRIVVQRVSQAAVTVSGAEVAGIGLGLLVLLGIEETDDETDAEWLVRKIAGMRIFPDQEGLMNRSLEETRGQLLVVSQFTLHASTKKGNRPGFQRSARPEKALSLYKYFVAVCEKYMPGKVHTGKFGAHMEVALVNDGPVTIFMDSRNRE